MQIEGCCLGSKSLLIWITGCFFIVMGCAGCSSAPHNLTDTVPLGSKLSDLDHLIHRGANSQGQVVQWYATKGKGKGAKNRQKNEFGVFETETRGDYDVWHAEKDERDHFTGAITFIDDGTTSADVNIFIYQDGKLAKKDWGFLPG